MLTVCDASKDFVVKNSVVNVFDRLNLDIKEGEFVCLLGPSGCGKSTLLNAIAGLEKLSKGQVIVNGNPVLAPGPDRIVMFQEAALFPWLKVIDNVAYGMKVNGLGKKERYSKASYFLKMVHLSKFHDVYVHQLSGGMRQRVALARALTMESPVLLMDEPFAALDSQTRLRLQLELQKIWLETKKTIIFVTHNVEEAVLLADRVVLMSARPGGIKKIYHLNSPRPRQFDCKEMADMINQLMASLKEEVDKVAKDECDDEGESEENTYLCRAHSLMGARVPGHGQGA